MVEILLGADIARRAFGQHRLHGLKECHIVADAQRLGVRNRQREGLGQLAHGAHASILALFLSKDVFLGRRQQAEPLLR